MAAFCARVQQSDIDAVVIGGDTTDHRLDAHTPAFLALAERVKAIAMAKPLLMLQGTFSHEPVGMLRLFGLFSDRIYVADRICQVALTQDGRWRASSTHRFDDAEMQELIASGQVRAVFSCLPTLNKAAFVANNGDDAQALGNSVAAVLAGWSVSNDAFAAAGIPTLGVSHGTVHGSKTEHGVPMHGLDHEYTTGALFAAHTSAFLLNHIHLSQSWECDGRRIAYSGSLPCLHYGERGDKGYLVWTAAANMADYEFIKSPAQRFAEFTFQGAPDLDELRLAEVAGCKVRVRYAINVEDRASVDDNAVRAALAGAVDVKIEPRLIPVQRSRGAGIETAQTSRDKLLLWCKANTLPSEQVNALATAFDELATSDADHIAARLIANAREAARHQVAVPA